MAEIEKATSPPNSTAESLKTTRSTSPAPDHERYTIWTTRSRHALVCLLGYLALASSLTATIYFPLLDFLADRYAVSIEAINLTVTLFMVAQAIAPSIWSPLSDTWGRRPVYLACFTLYTGASLGLSIVDRNYPALLVLRAMQSLGGATVLSLAYAVVADVTVHSERGRFLAPMLTAANIGPCIGPVIGGGAVLASGDPRWCFRALLIFGASGILLIGLAMPETNRTIVGNGAIPARGLWRTWWRLLFPRRNNPPSGPGTGSGKFTLPSPLPTLRLLLHPDTTLALILAASPYALWFCIQTSLSPIFSRPPYAFTPLHLGLAFLPGGAGVILGGFLASRLLDRNYRAVAARAGLAVDCERGDDVAVFPIEEARSRGSVRVLGVGMGVVVGYGWLVERGTHPAGLLVWQAVVGCKCTVLHQVYSALVVDVFPERTGTAAAANNVVRCVAAAAAVAALEPLVGRLGYGWVFTLLGVVDGVGGVVAVLVLRRWGRGWREKRGRRERLKRERGERGE